MNQLLISVIDSAVADLRYAIVDYLDAHPDAFRSPDDDAPDLDGDLDLDGRVSKIIDLAIPNDDQNLKWLIAKYAPDGANLENGLAAVYAAIYVGVEGWYDEHGGDFCENWLKNRQ